MFVVFFWISITVWYVSFYYFIFNFRYSLVCGFLLLYHTFSSENLGILLGCIWIKNGSGFHMFIIKCTNNFSLWRQLCNGSIEIPCTVNTKSYIFQWMGIILNNPILFLVYIWELSMMISNMVFQLLVMRTNTYPSRPPFYAPQGCGALDCISPEFQYLICFSFVWTQMYIM